MPGPVLTPLQWRYATKKFDPHKKIPEKEFSALLESLRLAPSSFGLQPWKFLIVSDPSTRKELVGHSWGQTQVADASHLIVLCSPERIDAAYVHRFIEDTAKTRGISTDSLKGYEDMVNGFIRKLSPEAMAEWMKNQIYIALGFLMYECAARRIDSCPMEGFNPAKYGEVLNLPSKGLRAVVLCPVGYRADDDKYADLKKVRYGADEVFEFI